jgi:hypothetical protein
VLSTIFIQIKNIELIKFSHIQGEEVSALLKFLADSYRLKIEVTNELVYCNDFYRACFQPEKKSIVLETINEQEVSDIDLPG